MSPITEIARIVSAQAPRMNGWSADIYDGPDELIMPGVHIPFVVFGRSYSWHISSHKIHGRSMGMSNQLFVIGPDGKVGAYSMGYCGAEREAIRAALRDIRKDAGIEAYA